MGIDRFVRRNLLHFKMILGFFSFILTAMELCSSDASLLRRANINADPVLRMITWNVADNTGMGDQFTDDDIDAVLGLDGKQPQTAEIYAIGLQEQCWMCNKKNMLKISNAFLGRLKTYGVYEVKGIEGTRMDDDCEGSCPKSHGTTAILVIARHGIVKAHKQHHYTQGCSDKGSQEKGVAYMQLTLANGKKACVATSHLESRSSKIRRECLRNFFDEAEEVTQWTSGCDFHFFSGDLNTRTAAEAPKGQKVYFPPEENFDFYFDYLKKLDELTGSVPWTIMENLEGNMLKFINDVQSNDFKESTLSFAPTYKLDRKGKSTYKLDRKEKSCAEIKKSKNPCYRSDRPLSWTDRIIYTAGAELSQYDSIPLTSSDHHPVYQEFRLVPESKDKY